MKYLVFVLIFSAFFFTSILSVTTPVTYQTRTTPNSITQTVTTTKIGTITQIPQNPKASFIEGQLTQVKKTLQAGNNAQIHIPINRIITDNTINCKQKTDFINQVNEILANKLRNNQQQLKILQSNTPSGIGITKPSTSTNPGNTNYQQEINMLEALKSNLLSKNYDSEIGLRQSQKKIISDNLTKFTQAAEGYLNQLRQFRKKNNITASANKQQAVIKTLQTEVQKNNKLIKDALNKRSQLQKNLTQIKLSILSQEMTIRESQSPKQLQALYRKYSEQVIQANSKSKSRQDELTKLQQQLKNKQLIPTSSDDDIAKLTKQLQQKKGPDAQNAISVLTQANQVLNTNVKRVQDKIRAMSTQCFM